MKHFRWIFVLALAFGAVASMPSVASAQDGADTGAMPTLEEELDLFWAERRGVRVVQRRAFEKDGRFYASLFFGAIPNDPYVSYFPIGGRLGYYLNEDIGFELSGSYIGDVFRSTSDVGEAFEAAGNDFFPRDQQQWRVNAVLLWSPMYGKFSFLGRRIANYDWNFSAGFGILGAEGPPERNLNELESSIKPEAILGTGWNIWLTDRWAMRLDYRQMLFQKTAGGVALPSEISLGVNFFF